MNETNLENTIIDYLNEELSSSDRTNFEEILKSDLNLQIKLKEFKSLYNAFSSNVESTPPLELKNEFNNFLESELKSLSDNQSPPSKSKNNFKQGFIFLLLLGVGLLIGTYLKPNRNSKDAIELTQFADNGKRENLLNLLEQKSTSKRIQAVNMSNYIEGDDNDGILDALIRTFLNDKSDHVRLACIESLSKYSDQPKVRDAFIMALDKEVDPTLQIALINVLSEIKEQKAVQSFDKIIQNDQSVNFVRDEAYSGKLKLIKTY